MNDKLKAYKEKATKYWGGRSTKQRGILLGSIFVLLVAIILISILGTRTNYQTLYSNLSLQEAGQIKQTLDSRGIPSTVSDNGTTILVSDTLVDSLKVDLAAEGIPNSGSIDYSFFQDQMGFGMTDNEFTVIERAAMQTELGQLIRNINGVNQANVMITLPEESVWLNTTQSDATAAIVLQLAPGYQLDQNQVNALFHLVSKSVPNLPIDNIVISDQMFNDYVYQNTSNGAVTTLSIYEQQREIKRDIERDLTRNLQQMLGTLVGQDKVLISVSTDIDFTQENRTEQLVEPVDQESMEGISISIERIAETYSGEGTVDGGVVGTGEDIPNYPGVTGEGPTEWEKTEERINNEVNRINRDIVESPYKIRDLGIQVMVEPPEGMEELPAQQLDDIEQILGTIVRTSIGLDETELTEEAINEKIFVSSQPFQGKAQFEVEQVSEIPVWLWVVGGLLIVTIIILVFLLLRKKKSDSELELAEAEQTEEIPDLPDEDMSLTATKRKQLEKMAREKPDEFSKLLRTWLSED